MIMTRQGLPTGQMQEETQENFLMNIMNYIVGNIMIW